jgi:cell division septation protein DedD
MIGPGTARVRLEVLGPQPLAAPVMVAAVRTLPPVAVGTFAVEVAALSDAGRAEHLRAVLASRFPDAFVSPLAGAEGRYFRVRLGPYAERAAALARAERVARLGYPAIIIEDATR